MEAATIRAKVFKCTQCEKCCTDLKGRAAGIAVKRGFKELGQPGIYSLPTTGGIQLWAWERERLVVIAKARALPLRTAPALVFADEKFGAVVLAYEVLNRSCPFFKTPLCTVYEERPLVCGAFPVFAGPREMSFTAFCPEVVVPGEHGDPATALLQAYGETGRAAMKIRDVTLRVAQLVGLMVESGALRPIVGLTAPRLKVLVSRRRSDLQRVMQRSTMFSREDVVEATRSMSIGGLA